MPFDDSDLTASADRLIRVHGDRVRQKVVDEIVQAIRAYDLVTAKRWDELGEVVDQQLAA